MKFSRWFHVLQRGDIAALVNSITLDVIYVPREDWHGLVENPYAGYLNEMKELFVSRGVLVNDQDPEERLLDNTRDELKSEVTLELLYLLVTDGCNLRCKYCFEESPTLSGSFKAVHMDEATVIKAVDLFAMMARQYGSPKKKKVIHLYGGEPLMNRKAIYRALAHVDHLKSHGLLPDSCQVTIVTNGVLLTEEDAKIFSAHRVTVGLSIDGPASITDFYRISKRHGLHVTERVTDAFRLLKRHGVSVGLSVTLTPEALIHREEFLDFFTRGEFREADGASLNLLHYTPRLEVDEDYYREATECQISAFERFRDLGLYEERVMRKVRAFAEQRPMYADCGVVGSQLVVAPDGRIGVCQDFVKPRTYFPRSVHDTGSTDLLEALFADWRNRSPFNMTECQSCSALGICGGGCPASAELKTGSRFNLDERACYNSKRILEWLVWDAYDKLSER